METDPPLAGRRVVVTRPREQAADFVEKLERAGAEVLLAPLIKISPPASRRPVEEARSALESYDWLVFTSANGVRAFLPEVAAAGTPRTRPKICAIGEATAAAVIAEGWSVDLLPSQYVAESVVDALKESVELRGARILLARAESGRDVVPVALREAGAEVTDLAVYRTVPDEEGAHQLRAELALSSVDVITFTSSSAVRNFANCVAAELGRALTASIGPVTSATIREVGWRVDIEAPVYSTTGLLEAIIEHYGRGEG